MTEGFPLLILQYWKNVSKCMERGDNNEKILALATSKGNNLTREGHQNSSVCMLTWFMQNSPIT